MKIDLHIHSTASDGKLTPKELIDYAIKKSVEVIALTDHDGVDGIKEALDYSKNKNIEFVSGVEFSANPKDLAKEIHIVGLFIDYNNENIRKLILRQKHFRTERNERIIKKLNELGYDISSEEIISYVKKEEFGRPNIAEVLMKKYSQFKDRKQVFNELLGKKGKAFCMDESSPMGEIINIIHNAGGIAVLAHPSYLFDDAERVIVEFVKLGGDGLEVECPYESFGEKAQNLRDSFRRIAEENNLIISGGTDFHEKKDNLDLGDFGLSNSEFKEMKDYIKNLKRGKDETKNSNN